MRAGQWRQKEEILIYEISDTWPRAPGWWRLWHVTCEESGGQVLCVQCPDCGDISMMIMTVWCIMYESVECTLYTGHPWECAGPGVEHPMSRDISWHLPRCSWQPSVPLSWLCVHQPCHQAQASSGVSEIGNVIHWREKTNYELVDHSVQGSI